MVVEDKSRHHLVRHNLSAFLLILIFIITFVAILVMHLAIGAVNKKGQSAKERGVQEDLRLHHNAHPAVGKESLRILTRRKKSVVQHIGNETLCRTPKSNGNQSRDSPFPADLFTAEQRQNGAIVLHFCGLVYMFVALAIVCDEFFVPSLGVITEVLDISDDVAGATFMAAGGSAPEFFTALFGVFITENNVGVGTIVGSATFNILCVLAFCTMFSRNVLALTWWPLFRDILFYSVALLGLSIFFLDERVHWTEALAMFGFYLLYALFMKYNAQIEGLVKTGLLGQLANRVEPQQRVDGNGDGQPSAGRNGQHASNGASAQNGSLEANRENPPNVAKRMPPFPPSVEINRPILHAGAHYPQIYPGIVQFALEPMNVFRQEAPNKPTNSNLARTFRKRESADHIIALSRRECGEGPRMRNGNKRLDKAKSLPSFTVPLPPGTPRIVEKAEKGSANLHKSQAIKTKANLAIGTNGLPPVNLVTQKRNLSPAAIDLNLKGHSPLPTLQEDSPKEHSVEDCRQQHSSAVGGTNGCGGSSTQRSDDNISLIEDDVGELALTMNGQQGLVSAESGRLTEQPIDLSWPSTFYKQCVFLALAPIMFPLYFTLPDVKKQDRKRFAAITFLGSVGWIAFFTYLMVWWASVIGLTLGIPTEIVGLTVLAAGTSIPDLITSVIVSRKGLGDMAVSSSIGSNLFDICVGLPIPWLLHFAIAGVRGTYAPISVESNGLLCSIGILFFMLIVLVGSVALTRWKMNKTFGSIMLLAYLFFCVFSVLLEKEIISCPLKIVTICRW